jgi:hypothetical protein
MKTRGSIFQMNDNKIFGEFLPKLAKLVKFTQEKKIQNIPKNDKICLKEITA